MSGLKVFLSLVAVLCSQCFAKLQNYDDFDIEALLLNTTRSAAFFECVRDDTMCVNKEDKDMKDDFMEMINTSCADCTPKEKKKYVEAMNALERSRGDSQVISMFINQITNLFQWGMTTENTLNVSLHEDVLNQELSS